ncbi:ETS homologous factor-like [Penaeus indicus]|uniref:ETS homologous factor-like n=1 Tax=Penaeus indicus TaxID=29960 RepID=UPI00300DA9BB
MMAFGYPGFTDTFVHSPFSLDEFHATGAATSIDTAGESPHHGASFQSLDVTRWRGQECLEWVTSICRKRGIDRHSVNLTAFRDVTGAVLMNLTMYDFCNFDSIYGSLFYEEFQQVCHAKNTSIVDSDSGWSPDDKQACVDSEALLFPEDDEWCQKFPNTNEDLEELLKLIDSSNLFCESNFPEGGQLKEESFSSEFYDDRSLDIAPSPSPEPPCDALEKISTKSRKKVRGPKNWEFMLRLLMDKRYNPELIRWENEAEKTFRLVRPDIIAQMWGKRANKHCLSYNNFARGLRYQYTTGALKPVPERQLVYQCGPKALQFWREIHGENS